MNDDDDDKDDMHFEVHILIDLSPSFVSFMQRAWLSCVMYSCANLLQLLLLSQFLQLIQEDLNVNDDDDDDDPVIKVYFLFGLFLPHLLVLYTLHGHIEQCIDVHVRIFCSCTLLRMNDDDDDDDDERKR